ncbi:MAG: hypothetical protein QOI83_1598, partial [Streptomycetaceae bacterium]|nr:hypothetical protein [Streptomycetaceae bacterium]
AIATAAVGVPSVALACVDRQDNTGNESYGHWKNASYGNRWTKATAPPSASGSATASATDTVKVSGVAARVVQLVNSARSRAGCPNLTVDAKLTAAAQDHSKDMADYDNMSHTGSDGSSPDDRITGAGYGWSSYGENIAYGYATPESVMAVWMASPGHRRNILDCSFKEIGVGLAQPGSYWTQDFGTPG